MEFEIYRQSTHRLASKEHPPCRNAIFRENKWVIKLDSIQDILDLQQETDEDLVFEQSQVICIYYDYIE